MFRHFSSTTVALALLSMTLGAAVALAPSTGHAQGDENLEASEGSANTTNAIGPGRIGLGLGRGTLASGLTGKFYLSDRSALQAHAGYTNGWGWSNCSGGRGRYDYDCRSFYGFGLNVDYLGTFAHLVSGSAGRLSASAGGGGALSSGGPYGSGLFAANGVVELGWHFSEVPIELAADWRPFIGFGSGGMFLSLFDFGFSARFYF